MSTKSGGSPYGATHWSGLDGKLPITEETRTLAIALGKRLAETALQLQKL
jgi:NAD(P)H dehydrogenase (quinone)